MRTEMRKRGLQRSNTLPAIKLDQPIIKSNYYPPGKYEADIRRKYETNRSNVLQNKNTFVPKLPMDIIENNIKRTVSEDANERVSFPSGRSRSTNNANNSETVKMPSLGGNNTHRGIVSDSDGVVKAINGSGTYLYENKFFKYEGQWKNGKKHGSGKLDFLDNSYYEGTFHNGEIEGFGTRFFAATGCKYQGQFHKGELHGKGRMVWPDGSIYEGHWSSNKKQGFGVMKSVKENCIYKGEFKEDKRQGQGMMIYPKGDRYQGDWYQNMRHGDGDMNYIDGTVYEGQFVNDNFNGQGVMRHCSGLIYNGIWQNGNPTVLPSKLVIVNETGKVPLEFIQGQPFDLHVKCINEKGDIVEIDSHRELRISAGFKYMKAKKGTALFDLIEEYEEKPMATPYYEVLQYPLTDFLAEEEEAGVEETELEDTVEAELRTSRENSRIAEDQEDGPVNELKEAVIGENRINETDEVAQATPAPPPDSSLERHPSIVSTTAETPMSGLTSATPGSSLDAVLAEKDSRPLPPPVANKRTEGGQCEWKNITLAQAPPRFPPFVVLDEEERKVRARQNKQVEAKRLNRVQHDERFARVGEYVLMVHDVTTPPFMGQTLEPAFILAKLKKPKREKKPKEVKPKWDTSKHIAESMVRI